MAISPSSDSSDIAQHVGGGLALKALANHTFSPTLSSLSFTRLLWGLNARTTQQGDLAACLSISTPFWPPTSFSPSSKNRGITWKERGALAISFEKGGELETGLKSVGEMEGWWSQCTGGQKTVWAKCAMEENGELSLPASLSTEAITRFWVLRAICSALLSLVFQGSDPLTSLRTLLFFSLLVVSDSLQFHRLQHARLPCLSLSPGVYSNSYPLSQWCHPTISSSGATFSSCPQSFLTSESFPMTWLFISGSQSIGASASAPVLPMSIQGWFPLRLTYLILLSKGLSRVFFSTAIGRHQLLGAHFVSDPEIESSLAFQRNI